LANHKSAMKRARQNIVRQQRNKAIRTQAKNLEKRVIAAKEQDDENIVDIFKKAQSAIHKAVKRNIFHKKTAGRKISKLARVIAS